MSTLLTEYAQGALKQMSECRFVSDQLWQDCLCNDANCPSSGNTPVNAAFNRMVEEFIARHQVCLAADTYNHYCQQILKLAIQHDPNVWHLLRQKNAEALKKYKREQEKKDQPPDRLDFLARLNSGHVLNDDAVRKTVHQTLGLFENPETKIICILRNILTHHRGVDSRDELAIAIKNLGDRRALIPPLSCLDGCIPIEINQSHSIHLTFQLGKWAGDLMENQIHLMDQTFSHRYSVPASRWRPCSVRRQMGTTFPKIQNRQNTSTPEDKPTMTTPEYQPPQCEIDFAKARRALAEAIGPFVTSYADEAKLEIRAGGASLVGSILPHTLQGQDMSFEYELFPKDPNIEAAGERLGIRIRSDNWKTKLTVWSTRTMMESFVVQELTDKVKDKIRDCMDKAFQS